MDRNILAAIASRHELHLQAPQPLAGGDINTVYHCASELGPVVVKYNSNKALADMFAKEARGLAALGRAAAFIVPEVYAYGETTTAAYLVMAYLPTAPVADWSSFGALLARQHRCTQARFGFPESNYIGSLVQTNEQADQAATFFISQRLEPQFRLAQARGYSFPDTAALYRVAEGLVPEEAPALLHGDLWSGNYLSTPTGFALIDPAVSYGPREMDLAMMQLFGGFPSAVFAAYEANYPTAPGLAERIPLYQLYYVLVHVNLFGGSYYAQAISIMRKYL